MSKLQSLKTIALFEMRTLLRSWFFRIFTILSILILTGFNAAISFGDNQDQFIFKSIYSLIPYVNILLINLGQAIIAIFLASEFIKQDKKNDTVEVIYTRSMSNATYILGKTLGILLVFLILNFIILGIAIIFSVIINPAAISIPDLLLYPVLISFPTLVFILGLSFLLMIFLKNQAITFIILLGYIALSLFYLNDKLYNVFDYIAYTIPMINSEIAGFGDIYQVLIHRGIYFFIGLGCIFLTIQLISRLPQSKFFKSAPLFISIIFIGTGFILAKYFVDLKAGEIDLKKEIIALNEKYMNDPTVSVLDYDIDLTHKNDKISVKANMSIQNKETEKINHFIFSLNPSLKVKDISINGKKADFERNLHLLYINCKNSLNPGQRCELQINYEGGISEITHNLDQNLDNYVDNFSIDLVRAKKRYAFLSDKFVCFTKETLWYPVSGVTYVRKNPAYQRVEFSNFKLQVHTNENLEAISQGQKEKIQNGSFRFQSDHPLPQISLLIGNYDLLSVNVNGIDYQLYHMRENTGFKKYFTHLKDTLPSLITDLKNEFESRIDLEYPFKRFMLAEVPVQFTLIAHNWSLNSDAVQPELMFIPEKGTFLQYIDFESSMKLLGGEGGGRRERFMRMRMGAGEETYSEVEKETMILKQFLSSNFLATSSQEYTFDDFIDYKTFSVFPNYYFFITAIKSKEWPILNLSLGAYYMSKVDDISNVGPNFRWNSVLNKEDRINLNLKKQNIQTIIKNGIYEPDIEEQDKLKLNDIILAKGKFLFSNFEAMVGEDKVNESLKNYLLENKHRTTNHLQFKEYLKQSFKINTDQIINTWYNSKSLPGFIIKDIETYTVKENSFSKYQLTFKISNPEKVDGLIEIGINFAGRGGFGGPRFGGRSSNENIKQKLIIPAGEARQIGFILTSQPSMLTINTNLSQNLPSSLNYFLMDFDEEKKAKGLNGIVNIPLFGLEKAENEIIVDNEDPGFVLTQETNEGFLKAMLNKNKKNSTYKYGLATFWGSPSFWKAVIKTEYYGKYIHSAHMTKANDKLRTATWNAEIKQDGFYDIFFLIDKEWGGGGRGRGRWYRPTSYKFKIHHAEGVDEIELTDDYLEKGWNYMGSFNLKEGTNKVELYNESTGRSIYADAIKWVKN